MGLFASGVLLSAIIWLIYAVLNAYSDSRISRFFLQGFGPQQVEHEFRSRYLLRVSIYSFMWTLTFAFFVGVKYFLEVDYEIKFSTDWENWLVYFFLGAAIFYTVLITVRSLIGALLLKWFKTDYYYVRAPEDEEIPPEKI